MVHVTMAKNLNVNLARKVLCNATLNNSNSKIQKVYYSKSQEVSGPSYFFFFHYFPLKRLICLFKHHLSRAWVRLICGIAERGTAEPAEPAEHEEMAVLLQLPLANVIK